MKTLTVKAFDVYETEPVYIVKYSSSLEKTEYNEKHGCYFTNDFKYFEKQIDEFEDACDGYVYLHFIYWLNGSMYVTDSWKKITEIYRKEILCTEKQSM